MGDMVNRRNSDAPGNVSQERDALRSRLQECTDIVYGTPEKAIEIAREVYARAIELDDPELLAIACQRISIALWTLVDHDRAQAVAEESLRWSLKTGDQSLIAISHTCIGLIALESGDPVTAQEHFEITLGFSRDVNDRILEAKAHLNLALVAAYLGNDADSHRLNLAAGEILTDFPEAGVTAIYHCNVAASFFRYASVDADNALREQRIAQALEFADRAIDRCESDGRRILVAISLETKVAALANLGRIDEAIRVERRLRTVCRECGADYFRSYHLRALAAIRLAQGRTVEAARCYAAAAALLSEAGRTHPALIAHRDAYRAYDAAGRKAQAYTHLRSLYEGETRMRAKSARRRSEALQVRLAIENNHNGKAALERHNEALKKQAELMEHAANTDSLTGLLNRRGFDATLGQTDGRVCLAFVDVDHFKLVNDRFGHAIGDEVLVQLARILRRTTREFDLVARYGGEEFVLLMRGVEVASAESLCARLLKLIEGHDWSLIHPELAVTVSIGIDGASVGDAIAMLRRADAALYCAKRAGRNRVHVANTTETIEDLAA